MKSLFVIVAPFSGHGHVTLSFVFSAYIKWAGYDGAYLDSGGSLPYIHFTGEKVGDTIRIH